MIADVNANPIQMLLRPARESDIGSFRLFELGLPENSVILGDKAYNDYRYEDRLVQEKQIHLTPIRKVNSKRRGNEFWENVRKKKRRMIETLFSGIERLMPRSIHAVTIAGLILKATLFVFRCTPFTLFVRMDIPTTVEKLMQIEISFPYLYMLAIALGAMY